MTSIAIIVQSDTVSPEGDVFWQGAKASGVRIAPLGASLSETRKF